MRKFCSFGNTSFSQYRRIYNSIEEEMRYDLIDKEKGVWRVALERWNIDDNGKRLSCYSEDFWETKTSRLPFKIKIFYHFGRLREWIREPT